MTKDSASVMINIASTTCWSLVAQRFYDINHAQSKTRATAYQGLMQISKQLAEIPNKSLEKKSKVGTFEDISNQR